jgi:hypothetical protein
VYSALVGVPSRRYSERVEIARYAHTDLKRAAAADEPIGLSVERDRRNFS